MDDTQQSQRTQEERNWEIEGLNDEDITAELLDKRVEFSTVTPLWSCGCDYDCDSNAP
ncbi:hypothetical protein [Ktedonosporobacter rubrisoli]|uniref:hypothetical protein n=1 Tax=Ktedonosporobacter rubrisoli TaxID=2509675 RepID=UPI0013EE475B|nr:hypothetical protein [Ktedonosporobacter rubrisoli]